MNLSRRGFLGGIIATATAPAIIRTAGLIMPIKPVPVFAGVSKDLWGWREVHAGVSLTGINRDPLPFWRNHVASAFAAYNPEDRIAYCGPTVYEIIAAELAKSA